MSILLLSLAWMPHWGFATGRGSYQCSCGNGSLAFWLESKRPVVLVLVTG
ncbi:hypothetical protein MGG_15693 [Pyricularia oryzae 70-15]|uniref:Uncharacterized protein n=3 Tax=Pyricularia oryzae TaxID=318829 RepID=G4MZJ7_PYRO7|nr:uncharacterized protein MGG_15693 [Pyricularia oryzae 70-15]EHA54556.1 hypothetical protein MGG_15693 [Pyricularia oryzae 70-15]ELQ37518.1 hypothetical protein OOU_Y34scaffold00590g32 [Pyricularia oryzae Y34]